MSGFVDNEKQVEKNFDSKTLVQLEEILSLHKKTLKNKNLISKLQDKGAKITKKIEELENLIKDRKREDETSDLFEKLCINAERSRSNKPLANSSDEKLLRAIINRDSGGSIIIDSREGNSYVSSYDRVVKARDLAKQCKVSKTSNKKDNFHPNRTTNKKDFTEMMPEELDKLRSLRVPEIDPALKILDEECHNDNDYRNVEKWLDMRKADEEVLIDKENLPESSNSNNIKNVNTSGKDCEKSPKTDQQMGPRKLLSRSPTRSLYSESSNRLKYNYDESLETLSMWRDSSRQQAKTLSIDESMKLQTDAEKKHRQMTLLQAQERLREKISIKVESWGPDISSFNSYRDIKCEDNYEDSTDEEERDEDKRD